MNLPKTLSFFKKAAPNIKKHEVFLMVWLSHASRHGCRKQPGMVAASNRAWLPQATGHGGGPGRCEIKPVSGRNVEEVWKKCGRSVKKCGRNVEEVWKKCGRSVEEVWKKRDCIFDYNRYF
jgi:hypothetical protein